MYFHALYAGTVPYIFSEGTMAQAGVESAGENPAGQGQAFPCGSYHAGEEVS